MTITTNPTRNQYEAVSSQTEFNYTFKIYSDQDLNVYLTPAGQQPDDSTDLITGYVIDSATIGNDNGGFITLDTPANNGDIITIVSNIAYNREVDYQVNGDFNPPTVNTDIDRTVSLVKQVKGLVDRAILSPESGESQGFIFPAAQEGKGLIWDDDGNLKNTDLLTGVEAQSDNLTITDDDGVVSIKDDIARIQSGSGNIQVSDDGNGTITISAVGAGGGDVTQAGNNIFTGGNDFKQSVTSFYTYKEYADILMDSTATFSFFLVEGAERFPSSTPAIEVVIEGIIEFDAAATDQDVSLSINGGSFVEAFAGTAFIGNANQTTPANEGTGQEAYPAANLSDSSARRIGVNYNGNGSLKKPFNISATVYNFSSPLSNGVAIDFKTAAINGASFQNVTITNLKAKWKVIAEPGYTL